MKHLELHILQSVPVSCLNRDDLNSPKTAIFGGVQRARVSSQSWKKAIRDLSKEDMPLMQGRRSKLVVQKIVSILQEKEIESEAAILCGETVANYLSSIDKDKKDDEGYKKVSTLCFFSEMEYRKMAEDIVSQKSIVDEIARLSKEMDEASESKKKTIQKEINKAKNEVKKTVGKSISSVRLKDAADIALFGRMVADDHSLVVEAASMYSHAISTHKVDNEIDFFTAVDDLQTNDEGGAAMMGSLEYNSATYYRFAALNLDMLKDEDHLAAMSLDERKEVVGSFIKSTLMAMPGARKNTMNGNTLPGLVQVVIREKGHPIQLINAFENPVVKQRNTSLLEESCIRMKKEYQELKDTWGLDETECLSFGKFADVENKIDKMDALLDKVKSYVE